MISFLWIALMALNEPDYSRCAQRIVRALELQPGESVLLKIDPPLFSGILEPLRLEIRKAGAYVVAAILPDTATQPGAGELAAIRALFAQTDALVWLPGRGNSAAVDQALVEWLDSRRGRAVHFHWGGGSYPIPGHPLPSPDVIDRIYLAALDADTADIERLHDKAIPLLRSGLVQVTTPEGTDIHFDVGDRPFSKQVGDASRERMRNARVRIDRDVELPAGVLRVAPIESSANGTIVLPVWRPIQTEGRNLHLTFEDGKMVRIEGTNAELIDRELTQAGGAAKMFREFALGFNPLLRVPDDHPFVPYYGYGDGVVRLSLGDNEEMGGANRGGGVYWNFFHNATVTVGNSVICDKGKLLLR
jgi:hypothetical protein